MSMLEVKDLVVSYGGIEALKGISFSVDEGQIVPLAATGVFCLLAGTVLLWMGRSTRKNAK